jgi:hypothetical protein
MSTTRIGSRLLVAVLAIVAVALLHADAGAQSAPAAPSRPAEDSGAIGGFRSAQFGMNEADVRKAIAKDLGVKPQDIKADVHPTEKTKLLSVTAKDLLPETGTSLVTYHLGYKSKQLMQVTIVWGRPVQADPDPQRLVGTANLLRNYFAAQQFQPEGRVLNAPVEGGIVVFRGFDKAKRMVLLMLSAQPGEATAQGLAKDPAKGEAKDSQLKNLSLQLFYVLNPEKPDVFAIEKGQF